MLIRKLQMQNNNQFMLTLPSSIIRAKGWNKQDSIQINISEKGDIILKKLNMNRESL